MDESFWRSERGAVSGQVVKSSKAATPPGAFQEPDGPDRSGRVEALSRADALNGRRGNLFVETFLAEPDVEGGADVFFFMTRP